jgi:hypothetical protein
MDGRSAGYTSALSSWQQQSIARLRRFLLLRPEQAPAELTPLEAFALIEWCRMTALADCDAAGVGAEAQALLRARLARR